jgi:hypothetical protein
MQHQHCLRQSVENVFQQGRSAALNVIQEWHQCYVGSADHQANLERISKFDSQLSLHLAALSQYVCLLAKLVISVQEAFFTFYHNVQD